MQFANTLTNTPNIHTIKTLVSKTDEKITHDGMIYLTQRVSKISALLQIVILLLTMLVGAPGVYIHGEGFMYISDNFCTKRILAGLFMFTTFPSWVLLAFSVSKEKDFVRRKLLLLLISTPFPVGIGIVFFSLCTTPVLHYIYVNVFVVAIAGVHLAVARTARHFVFLQVYCVVLIGTATSGLVFLLFALSENGPGTRKNIAAISEYIAIGGFVLCNSLISDRIREHIHM
jgi:hypothetical protein